MDKVILFSKTSKGKIKQWSIWTEPNGYVCREWGQKNGKLQLTKDKVKQKNVGKSNETSLEEQAELEAQRILEKKKEEGYSKNINSANKSEINWADAILPKTFAPSKPQTSITYEDEQKLIKSGNAIYQRKHNGMRAFLITGEQYTINNIYSRRLEIKTANFPTHELCMKFFDRKSIFDCEVVVNDDPDLVKTIFGAKPEKAIERQEKLKIKFIIFDILYHDGKDITNLSYEQRYNILEQVISDVDMVTECATYDFIDKVENINKPKKIPEDWEGLILRDKTSPTKIRWDGKPDRKSGSFKIKKTETADLVCYEWMYGKGKLSDTVATLKLGAYDKKGNLVHVCESGSGLDGKSREEILKLSPNKKNKFVVEIKYEEYIPKSGSLRLPIFLRVRNDKEPLECLLEDIS